MRLADACWIYPEYAMPVPSVLDEDESFIPFGIVGGDTRVVVISALKFTASAVVQINFIDANFGMALFSGTLIAANTVRTAVRCVCSINDLDFLLRWRTVLELYPGRNGSMEPFGQCGVSHAFELHRWGGNKGNHDMAGLRLACSPRAPTCYSGIWLASDGVVEIPVTGQGYPPDKLHYRRQFKSEEWLVQVQTFRISRTSDTFGGTCASPIYRESDHRLFAVRASAMFAEKWTGENNVAEISHATRTTPGRLNVIKEWNTEHR